MQKLGVRESSDGEKEREKIGFSTFFTPKFKEISENMSVEKINKCQEAIEIP